MFKFLRLVTFCFLIKKEDFKMDSFDKSFISTIIGIVIVCCAMTTCTVRNNNSDNAAMAEMVKNGAEPLAARCAVKGSTNQASECAILAAKKQM
jgi:hypothetical protein